MNPRVHTAPGQQRGIAALGPVPKAAQLSAGRGRGVFGTTFVPKAAQVAPRRTWAAFCMPSAGPGAVPATAASVVGRSWRVVAYLPQPVAL